MSTNGFTLVELLIVFAIALLVLSLTGSIASNTYPKSQLRSHSSAVTQTLREAQAFTITKKHDSVWGVHLTQSNMTLFAGASYATRDTAYDRTHAFPSNITAGGLTDIVFDAFVGTTAQTGTVTLTSLATGEIVNVTVNENGNVEW